MQRYLILTLVLVMFASSVVAQPQQGEKVLVLPFRVYAGDDISLPER